MTEPWAVFPKQALTPATYLLLAGLALLLFLPGFFDLPPIDRDEARFVQASRQMIESGDYVDIRFQEETRYKKPVGIYWLQAGAALLSGEGADAPIWVFRLVSLLGALAAVLLTAWAGATLFGPSAGLLAGLLLAGSLLLGVEARLAKTDAVLLASIVLAQGALARLYLVARQERKAGWGPALLFWAAIGLSILVKGPIGPLVAGLTLVTLGLAERRWRWMLALRPLAGMPLAAMIVLPWLLAIMQVSGGAFLQDSLGGDLLAKLFQGQESHGAPPGYYLLTFWVSAWPFGFLVLLAVLAAWRSRRDPAVLFCLAWIGPSWLLFEGVSTKLPHYTLPLYPALFLLSGRLLAESSLPEFGRWQGWLRQGGWWLQGALSLILALAALAVPPLLGMGFFWESLLAACAVLVAGFLAMKPEVLESEVLGRSRRGLALILGAALVFYVSAYQMILPRLSPLWLSPRIAQMTGEIKPCLGTRLAAAGYTEPSLAVLVGTDTRLGSAEVAAAHLLADRDCGLALVEERSRAGFLQALGRGGAQAEAVATLSGFNYSRGQQVVLTFYRVAGR